MKSRDYFVQPLVWTHEKERTAEIWEAPELSCVCSREAESTAEGIFSHRTSAAAAAAVRPETDCSLAVSQIRADIGFRSREDVGEQVGWVTFALLLIQTRLKFLKRSLACGMQTWSAWKGLALCTDMYFVVCYGCLYFFSKLLNSCWCLKIVGPTSAALSAVGSFREAYNANLAMQLDR